jgi:hypothetical protein
LAIGRLEHDPFLSLNSTACREEDLLRMEVLTDLFEKKDQMSRAAKDAILEGIKTEPLRTSVRAILYDCVLGKANTT